MRQAARRMLCVAALVCVLNAHTPQTFSHDSDLAESTWVAVKSVGDLRLRNSDPLSAEVLRSATDLLRAIPKEDLHHLATGAVRWKLSDNEHRKWVSVLAGVMLDHETWGQRINLSLAETGLAARDRAGDVEALLLLVVRQMNNPHFVPALDILATHRSARVRCAAGRLLALYAHFLDQFRPEQRRWVVSRLRRLVEDRDARVRAALPIWIVAAELPQALKPLVQAAGDDSPVAEESTGVMSRTAATVAMGVVTAIEGAFGLNRKSVRFRPPTYTKEAIAEWLSTVWEERALYQPTDDWSGTLDIRGEFVIGEPFTTPTDLGPATITVLGYSLVTDSLGPGVSYRLRIQIPRVGELKDESPLCYVGLTTGTEASGPDVHDWRVLTTPAPGSDERHFRARVRAWRKRGP